MSTPTPARASNRFKPLEQAVDDSELVDLPKPGGEPKIDVEKVHRESALQDSVQRLRSSAATPVSDNFSDKSDVEAGEQ